MSSCSNTSKKLYLLREAKNKKMVSDFFNQKQAAEYLGICRSTFRRGLKAGTIPQGIQLSERLFVWNKKDLDLYFTHNQKKDFLLTQKE